jgi:hypothetical protein
MEKRDGEDANRALLELAQDPAGDVGAAVAKALSRVK